MQITVRPFGSLSSAEAMKLASLCRGKIRADELEEWEDWDWIFRFQTDADGPVRAFLLLETPEESPTATIRAVCARDKGTGAPQELIKVAERYAQKLGKTTLDLDLVDIDEKLIEVYTKLGFAKDPEQYGWMTKSLKTGSSRVSRVKKQTRRTKGKRRKTIRKKL